MTVLKAVIYFDTGQGEIYQVDVIEHLGAFWLVPEWLENPELKMRMPSRIISLMTLQHQDVPNNQFPRFIVNVPVSKAVFDGRISAEKAVGYIVIDKPEIALPLPSALN